jgi:hypothetical protein
MVFGSGGGGENVVLGAALQFGGKLVGKSTPAEGGDRTINFEINGKNHMLRSCSLSSAKSSFNAMDMPYEYAEDI